LQGTKNVTNLRTLTSLSPVPTYLHPKGGELDRLIGALVEKVLNSQGDANLAVYVLEHSGLNAPPSASSAVLMKTF
jgi:hypothetical protein